jgi:transposase-like protein
MKEVNYYTDEFKQKVVNEVLNGLISKEEARRRYGIRGKSAVLNWMRKFDASKTGYNMVKKKDSLSTKSREELEAENLRLKQELEEERFRNRALNVMIDIAERQFNIPIRKKRGARQSKK